MLFYKNYIVYYNVYCYYCGVFIVYTKFRIDWSELHGPIVMYGLRLFVVVLQEAVWPISVYTASDGF